MGCAMFGDEKGPVISDEVKRSNRRTQLIDCRKKSTHALTKILENIQVIAKGLSREQMEMCVSILKDHNLFKMLTLQEIEGIVKHIEIATVEDGAEIFQEGDKGSCFFIIEEGQVEIILDPKTRKTLRKGECFGQVALIYACKRTASATNITQSKGN